MPTLSVPYEVTDIVVPSTTGSIFIPYNVVDVSTLKTIYIPYDVTKSNDSGSISVPYTVNDIIYTVLAGDIIILNVGEGSSVGVTGNPIITGTSTSKKFIAPISSSDVNITVTVSQNNIVQKAFILVKKSVRRVYWNGQWQPSYKVLGESSFVPSLILSFSTQTYPSNTLHPSDTTYLGG